MAFYNLMKAEDRKRYRADHEAELNAALDGSWPRDINDLMRWVNYPRNPFDSNAEALRQHREYAAKMCRAAIAYVGDLERRVAAGESDVGGYEAM